MKIHNAFVPDKESQGQLKLADIVRRDELVDWLEARGSRQHSDEGAARALHEAAALVRAAARGEELQ